MSDSRDQVGAGTADVVVIGSGLVGSIAAKELGESGLSVLILEAGPALTSHEISDTSLWTTRRRHEAAARQPIQSKHPAYWVSSPTAFVDDVMNPYSVGGAAPFLWIRGRQVGGRSLTWGGVMLRISDYEFTDPTRDGMGPEWPFGYAEVAPFYDAVERLFGVCGSVEDLAELPDGQFNAPATLTTAELQFKLKVEPRMGCHVIPCRGIGQRQPDQNHDPAWAPKSSLNRILPLALNTGRVHIRPDSIVSHLRIDSDDARPEAVVFVDRLTGEPQEVKARFFVLAASTIETIRILLNSTSRQHPEGLGNSSGLLGKGLVEHFAVLLGGPLTGAQGTPSPLGGPNALCIPRFRNLKSRTETFARGYGIWGGLGRSADSTGQGLRWFLTAVGEVVSRDTNSVTIDRNRVDNWGINVPTICLTHGHNEQEMKADAVASLYNMAAIADLQVDREYAFQPGQYVHELGGARLGAVARTSVLNPYNRLWDAKNVVVVDGSCFPSAGWQNPTLTMMALAMRASRHLAATAESH